MDQRFDIFPKEAVHRASMATSVTRMVRVHKSPTRNQPGTVHVTELTLWKEGTLDADDVLARDYCAMLEDMECKLQCLRCTNLPHPYALRWARLVFPEFLVVPPPINMRSAPRGIDPEAHVLPLEEPIHA